MAHFATESIRTVALVGDGAAGKTTLAEALLAKAGAIPAAGSVERGTTVSDHDPLEKTYQHSLRASLLHFETDGTRVHLIDTPGFPDFIGQSIGALDAVETAAVVINASSGVQMIASRMMEWAAKRRLCRLVIVNRIDAENVDLPAVLTSIRNAFGKECLPINLPAGNATRVVDCFFNPKGESDFSSVEEAHRALVDQVVEVDEDLMALYLEQGEIEPAQLHAPFEKALREGHLVPVCFVSARTGAGVPELIDVLVKLAPNPTEGNPPLFYKGEGDAATEFRSVPDPSKHVLAHVFKVVVDPFVGKARRLPRAPGHDQQGNAALRRRQPQVVQGRASLHAPGCEVRRGRPGRARRSRRRRQGRRDRVRPRAARFARRGPHPHAAARVPGADARIRDHAQAARRRAAHLRRAAQDDGRGSDAGRRARPRRQRDGAARPGRAAPALGVRADGEPVQAGGRDAAAARALSRDDHVEGGRPPPPQEADRRRGAVRRGVPARRAAAARQRLRVRRPGQRRRDPQHAASPRCRRASSRSWPRGPSPASRCRTCA